MTECEEVAVSMNPLRRLTFDEALRLVRGDMLDGSETIISNVAEAWPRSVAGSSLPCTRSAKRSWPYSTAVSTRSMTGLSP